MIEVGEYIRLDDGTIGKYQENKNWINVVETNDKYIGFDIENDIVKHSKNIIDLIEVGDFVNKEPVEKIEKDEFDLIGITTTVEFLYNPEDIKTILTHEQYEQNCYKIGE